MRPGPLDTDILSAIMRRNVTAVSQGRLYLLEHEQFTFSIITRYEILRGLKAKEANVQLAAFNRFCTTSHILPATDEVIVPASDIYADLHRRGTLISDADILIASTAMVHNLVVVTNNEAHFNRIPGLTVENWLKA